MILYLDNSFLNRPFDNPDIENHRLETEILFFVLGLVRKEKASIVNSSTIAFENSLNPFEDRKVFIKETLKHASIYQSLNEQIKKKAIYLGKNLRLSPIDSLHLATAEHAEVDFFITCDYNLIKKYKGNLKVIKPLDFLNYYENANN